MRRNAPRQMRSTKMSAAASIASGRERPSRTSLRAKSPRRLRVSSIDPATAPRDLSSETWPRRSISSTTSRAMRKPISADVAAVARDRHPLNERHGFTKVDDSPVVVRHHGFATFHEVECELFDVPQVGPVSPASRPTVGRGECIAGACETGGFVAETHGEPGSEAGGLGYRFHAAEQREAAGDLFQTEGRSTEQHFKRRRQRSRKPRTLAGAAASLGKHARGGQGAVRRPLPWLQRRSAPALSRTTQDGPAFPRTE